MLLGFEGLWTIGEIVGSEHWYTCQFSRSGDIRTFVERFANSVTTKVAPVSGMTFVLDPGQAFGPATECFAFCAVPEGADNISLHAFLEQLAIEIDDQARVVPSTAPALWEAAVVIPTSDAIEDETRAGTGCRPLWSLSVWKELARRFAQQFPEGQCRLGRSTGVWARYEDMPGIAENRQADVDEALLLCLESCSPENFVRLLHFVDDSVFGEWRLEQVAVYLSVECASGLLLRRKRKYSAEDTIKFYDQRGDFYYELWGPDLHWGIFRRSDMTDSSKQLRDACHIATQRSLTLLALNSDDVCLDLACGSGAATLETVRKGARICLGLDSSISQLRHAEDMAKRSSDTGGDRAFFVHALAADVGPSDDRFQYFPFQNEVFTKVLCQSSLYYFHHKPVAINEVARCLRPGGIFVMDDMTLEPCTPSKVRFDIYRRQKLSRVFSLADYQHQLASTGLDVVLTENRTEDFIRTYECLLGMLSNPDLPVLQTADPAFRNELKEGFELLIHAAERGWVGWWLIVCHKESGVAPAAVIDVRNEHLTRSMRGRPPVTLQDLLACPFCRQPVMVNDRACVCPSCGSFPRSAAICDLRQPLPPNQIC